MKKATRLDGFNLLRDGAVALSKIEANGIRIDVDYLDRTIRRTERRMKKLEDELRQDEVYDLWRREFGRKTNLGSRPQLGKVLFDVMGIVPKVFTASSYDDRGNLKANPTPSVDKEAFARIDLPFVRRYEQLAKLDKARGTYLLGIRREVCEGFLHPSFLLNTVSTFRSCIAKGTLIEVVRDVSKYPNGIPIEDVKPGDLAYCFDQNGELTIRPILWSGKTGHREVIRIHWSARGKKGFLDLTPEHHVRLASGEYVKAEKLTVGQDFRSEQESRHSPKIRCMAMGRCRDRLFPTGKQVVWDHRLVYETQVGPLSKKHVIHHKDGNHLNNDPNNLQIETPSTHARLHVDEHLTPEARARGHDTLRRMWADGELEPKFGADNPNWISLTKVQLLRMLARNRGKSSHAGMDFNCLKRKAGELGIDLKTIKDRYDWEGHYISLGRLRRAAKKGRAFAQRAFRVNHYKIKKLFEERGLDTRRKWANQCGPFVPHNHKITKLERLGHVVDVYDLEVEEHHNFIANELCAHNSSADPNFQNIPVRDPEVGKLIRRAFVPRPSRRLVEIDYGGIEVRISACYHKDPTFLEYVRDPSKDMHRDTASELFGLKVKEVNKVARYIAKNQFVFPQFYGAYWHDCAAGLWNALHVMNPTVEGSEETVLERMRSDGIKKLGKLDADGRPQPGTFAARVKEVCDSFWNDRFPIYERWKRDWYGEYLNAGRFRMKTGFVEQGLYSRNDCINHPVQGAAFHCLLLSVIKMQAWLERKRMESLLVGQIHDSVLGDVVEGELQAYLHKAKRIMTVEVPKAFPWIIVPLEIEVDVTPVDGSWHEKEPWVEVDGTWQPKPKS